MSRLVEIIKEYRLLGIPDQIDYDKLYLYSIITHSTAVEGSTVTEIENRLLFDEGISPDKPLAEQLMNLDLKNAYEEAIPLAMQHRDYDVELLCHLSGMVMKNTGSDYSTLAGKFSSSAGDLRLLNVTAGRGGKSYMSYQKIPQRLKDYCAWLNTKRKSIKEKDIEAIYELSFMAHYNLVYIHPWADGNGRMSRLVMNMIQMEFGLIPCIVKKENRNEYIKSLADAQEKENAGIFLDFMVNLHINNIETAIEEYKESIHKDTLNLEKDTLNDTINLTPKEKAILEIIKEKPNATIMEIAEKTGFSRPTVTRAISNLKGKQLLERNGARKKGFWRILGWCHN